MRTVPKRRPSAGILKLLQVAQFLAVVWLASCQSYNSEVEQLVTTYETGDFAAAADQVTSEDFLDQRSGRIDGLLFQLEAGKVLFDAGRFAESVEVFEGADAILRQYDYQADISISEEALALATSQTTRPYRGTEYDRILLEVYQTLNYLALDDLDEAMVHTRRAFVRQSEAVNRNADEISAQEGRAKKKGIDAEKVYGDPGYASFEQGIQTLANPAYADYVNPLANFLSAILLREEGDTSNALVDLRKLAGMLPENHYLPLLIEEFEAGDAPAEDRFYVIFENGMAPLREEFRLNLVTFQQGYSTFAIPRLVPLAPLARGLRIVAPGGELDIETELMASVDSIVATDFKARLPGIVISTLLSLVGKEVLTHQADNKDKSGWAFLAANVFKAATSAADLRTWRTLGAEFQIAMGTRPANGIVELQVLDGAGRPATNAEIRIPRARTTIIFLRTPVLSAPYPHVFSIGLVEPPPPPLAGPEMESTPDTDVAPDA